MDLSIVIVNYNVKYFLEQCLLSVRNAISKLDAEIFVVDNNSVDGSCAMIREKFPEVRLIENNANLGFSKANNQAIKEAKGEFILLLNPDTVIEEDTLDKCIGYVRDHPETGGLTVKMIDGNGNFLPESKRSLPTPRVAFYKIFGLSRLFPRSRIFSKYHLGYLNQDEVNEIEILPGAFMLISQAAIDKVGLLDETFFMYGEDIDYSYRLIKAGYKNVYFPKATIIHYKGESTKKGSLNYVLTFYNAMIIFARKHYSVKMAKSYSLLIHLAIYFRASLALLRRFVKNFAFPITEAVLFFFGFVILKPVWEGYKFPGGGGYPDEYMFLVVPGYILIWLLSIYFSGGYDRPVKLMAVSRGLSIGTIIILVIYALLPEHLRYSRALLLMGAGWALLSSILIRLLFQLLRIPGYELDTTRKKRIIIVGKLDEADRVKDVLQETDVKADIIGYVNPGKGHDKPFLGDLDQLLEVIKINKIDEIIFCSRDLTSQEIIHKMMTFTDIRVNYKIAPQESLAIIGSRSINTAGDLYLIEMDSINKSANRRNKRVFDIITSLLLIVCWPVLLIFIKNPGQSLLNILKVLLGACTWVGYQPLSKANFMNMPVAKPCILTPVDKLRNQSLPEETIERLNVMYVKNYKLFVDLEILIKGIPYIGRKPIRIQG
ncbi:MAG: glycosyltransferase [Bacteroidales bacterium]|nr:glycosyltransferase [Bacteroidales bacterium]